MAKTSDLPARVAIVGATASGKSAIAMEVARRLGDVELISVDSMQVYRGMDIGTAKPSDDERAEIPHHGIDLVDPSDEFTVAEFRREVGHALSGIAARGNRALFVGGTGLYHRMVIDDFDLPGEFPDVRAELERDAATGGLAVLVDRLRTLDPSALDRIDLGNRRRLVRALEVTIGSGRPFSSYGPGLDTYPPTAVAQIGVRWPRPILRERIERRVAAMIDAGLLEEVRRLHRSGAGLSRTAAQALGYKELIDHVEGRVDLATAVGEIITRTRQFAVRQERWFRRDPRIRWVDVVDRATDDPYTDPVPRVAPVVCDAFG